MPSKLDRMRAKRLLRAIFDADPDMPDHDELPELTPEERAAMDALPPDFIQRLLRGERPLGNP